MNNQIYLSDIENLGFEGNKALFHTPAGDFEAWVKIPGEHNLYNAMAAAAVGLELGLTLDEIKAGIETGNQRRALQRPHQHQDRALSELQP